MVPPNLIIQKRDGQGGSLIPSKSFSVHDTSRYLLFGNMTANPILFFYSVIKI
jgi:hypothetical protein